MRKDSFASHLGFESWRGLVAASTPIASVHAASTWFVVRTNTWYKWVAWDTEFNVLFNNADEKAAKLQLKDYIALHEIQRVEWIEPKKANVEFSHAG